MLDRASPANQRGFLQGMNVTIMAATNSIAPWVLGALADTVGTIPTLTTTLWMSILAALVNLLLYTFPVFQYNKRQTIFYIPTQWKVETASEHIEVRVSQS